MIRRGANFKPTPLNIAGSSTFGRYPKISIEKTFNMFVSDEWLVPYGGYQLVPPLLLGTLGTSGRGIHNSTNMGKLIAVVSSNVWAIDIFFNQTLDMSFNVSKTLLNPNLPLVTTSGQVYITENNAGQILISDNEQLYVYDPNQAIPFQVPTIDFVPGFVDFHDTYFLAAAQGTSTWRLSASNNGLSWPNDAAHVGSLQTKPDQVQAVVRFPSRGNMILVMGSTVTEPWYDIGYQLFPYQRSNSYTVDYGCLNPATIATMDDLVVWLAINEKSGPIIMYTTGGMPEKITTDGIDYLFSQLSAPEDSQAFLYRQDGHIFYHINFYTDNLSLFYDFNTRKFYHASDQNLNYFIANEVAFFNNQYYFLTNQNGNLYAFDTIFTTYQTTDALGNIVTYEIPRIRTCKSVRSPTQEYFIANDCGFTIEQGETPYNQQDLGPIFWITQDSQFVVTQATAGPFSLISQDNIQLITQDGNDLIAQNLAPGNSEFLIFQQRANTGTGPLSLPRVDLSISIDGGQSFSSDFPYVLNPPGLRKNRLYWWQLGLANDWTPQFKFWGLGRFVATDGVVNIRQ